MKEDKREVLIKAFVVALTLFTLALITPIIGYICGSIFELVFSETWKAVHTWLQMPENLTGGMLGAFMGCFFVRLSNGK